LGNYLPRQCGIATFTSDVCSSVAKAAPDVECVVAAMNDIPGGYAYPDRVCFELPQQSLPDYRRLAEYLNLSRTDLLCIQHEFGIYGGPAGGHLLNTMRQLRIPIVTTMHTVLRTPDEHQHRVTEEICRLSDRLVVMSERSVEFLREIYGVPAEKIDFIHHGIPDMPFVDPNYYKDKFGVEGRDTILTFGLIGPGKGIEYMIEAMPAIVERFPDIAYIVLGATHPAIRREQGETYRLGLEARAKALGVAKNVIFHNRFVELPELCEYLGSADMYVTPYLNEEQIVSGTLAYAFGTGKAVVSTPYWYAQELLAENRGRLVPFRNSEALAEAVIDLLSHPVPRHAMRKRAYTLGRQMIWPEVSRRYLESFQRAFEARRKTGVFNRPKARRIPTNALPEFNIAHVETLTDETGILQHTRHSVPNRGEGYATDDNARALALVMRELSSEPEDKALQRLAFRYVAFLDHAFNRKINRFRNFLGYNREWLEPAGSEDSHARAIWSLGITVDAASDPGQVAVATELFNLGLNKMEEFTSPRAWAFGLLGIHEYLKRFPGDRTARRMRDKLATELIRIYGIVATDEWPWFETYLTYGNARLSEALLVAGPAMNRPDIVDVGLKSLDWLVKIQTSAQGHFVPVGTGGWFRDGDRSRFDQQPIEAHTMVAACARAYELTGEQRWQDAMQVAFEWFLGRNDLGLPLCEPVTGGCYDGLNPEGVNRNQGAESTLSFLLALQTVSRTRKVPEEPERCTTETVKSRC